MYVNPFNELTLKSASVIGEILVFNLSSEAKAVISPVDRKFPVSVKALFVKLSILQIYAHLREFKKNLLDILNLFQEISSKVTTFKLLITQSESKKKEKKKMD